ncbi:MAG: hypothetical protein WBW48_01455 [Anaerolineae bacterium]
MSVQECALYGDLVLWLRDRAAELLAEAKADSTMEAETARLDELIRSWFFTPQEELYGSAPREVIWREQLGESNPVPKEYADDFIADDNCPICQAMRQEIESTEDDHEHGWHWTYCPDSCLLDLYDPEGSEERWQKEFACHEEWEAQEEERRRQTGSPPPYNPPPIESKQVDPETFLEVLRRPWLDPELHKVAQKLTERCDVSLPNARSGLSYRRLTRAEATSLVAGLHQQGADVQALLDQIEAWPYQNVALDWLSEPEQNAAMICQAMGTEIDPADEDELARFRQHRDFIFTLARLIPPGARLWLQGWLEAVAHGAFSASDAPF